MNNFKLLHEGFVNNANRPNMFGEPPIRASEPNNPIIAVNSWKRVGDPARFIKTFVFKYREEKRAFIDAVLDVEEETQHPMLVLMDDNNVTVGLVTKGIDKVTKHDKKIASHLDEIFKDIVYSSNVEGSKEPNFGDGSFEDIDERCFR